MKTYNFGEFMRNEHKKTKRPPKLELIPLAIAPLMPVKAFAASEEMQAKMIAAFNPIIDLIQAMAYPIAMVVVLGGAIYVMIGNSDKGFSMMQKAGLGYAIVMVSPMILNVLVDAIGSVAS